MYLTERKLFFSINHVFSGLTGRREREDFAWFREYFPAIETRNSHMLESANAHAASLARHWHKIAIGGSDAHALPSVGTAYTEVPGARDKEEFFAGLQSGAGPRGRRIGQLPEADARRFSHRIRNDARKILDGAARAAGCAGSRGHLLELSRGTMLSAAAGRHKFWINHCDHRKRARWVAHSATRGGGMGMTVAKAVWNQIQSNDHRLMRRVHRWRAPRWFRILMIVATRGGDGWLWYALGLILLICGGEHRFAAIGAGASPPRRGFSCSARSSAPAGAKGPAKSSRTAGRRFCRRTNIRFLPATRSRRLPWRCRWGSSIRIWKSACWPRRS